MRFRTLLLAGTILPFALSHPGAADESPAAWVVAQAEQECPEGAECPPAEQPAEQPPAEEPPAQDEPAPEPAPEQPAEPAPEPPAEPAPEQPAPEQPPAQEAPPEQPVEEPAPEQPAEQPAEAPAPEQPAQEEPAAEPVPEQPAEQQPAEEPAAEEPAQEPAPEQPAQEAAPEEPAAEQPAQEAAPAAEPAAPGGAVERAQRRREELRRQRDGDQPAAPEQAEQPVEQPSETVEQDVPADEQQAAEEDTTVEEQLEAQGDSEDAEQVRSLREQLLDQLMRTVVPGAAEDGRDRDRDRDGRDRERGDRDGRDRDRDRGDRDRDGRDRDRDRGDWNRWDRDRFYDRDDDWGEVVERRGGRIIIDLGGGNLYVEQNVPDEGGRLLYGARDVEVQELPGGRTRTIVYRDNGVLIVTDRNRYGDIIRRTKVLPNGREIVLIDNRFDDDAPRRPLIVDVRPPRVDIPQERYIVDLGGASQADIRGALLAPPVEQMERAYTLDEVLRNEDIRAYSPRIDLDTITFEFGSATIGTDQMPSLFALGEVMEDVLAENPDEVYLIEGHTDLVGSDYDNLILSDRRAEAVAVALSQNFDIPPENLVTEGYGEQYPKVMTEAPERRNRRATVRRLTELLQAQAN